ncbi:alpha/beta fold hydrolase [Minwuia thermotolerans]|uniref:AB hydrolase-1 domain-containing protein n=1 Tax=Minwuia thermotolerans TaxID=2056226 RepID=A0A2M9FX21_9PROT|nr:alpha/beta hydrolase [Minwuia thermotolerans]PJK28007.1 hypothetical protein CVT23_19290 [Minwuia thermotolerans]
MTDPMRELELEGGRRLTYRLAGSGPVRVLMIHGGAATSGVWAKVVSKLGEGYEVILPNLLGYEGSGPRPTQRPARSRPNAEALAALVAETGAPDIIVGHSTGAHVALDMAVNLDAPAKRLLFLEPAILDVLRLAGDQETFSWAEAHFLNSVAPAWRRGEPGVVGKMLDGWCGEGAFARLPKPAQAYMEAQPGDCADEIEATFQPDFSADDLTAFERPVDVVYGDSGSGLSPAIARALAALLPDCRSHSLTGADHNLVVTHGSEIADCIRRPRAGTGAPVGSVSRL